MSKMIKILYEHWVASFSVVLLPLFLYLKENILLLLKIKISLWQVLFFLTLIYLTYYLYKKTEKKESKVVLVRPVNKITEYGSHELFGLNWRVWLGCGENFNDRSIWADGPYCKKCDYELDFCQTYFYCLNCDKKYTLAKNILINTYFKAIKIFDARARSREGLQVN